MSAKEPDHSTRVAIHVVIPTYNRPAALLSTLEAVVPQLGPNDLITVLDNQSETDETRQMAGRFPTVEYFRNPINIGANANILRTFEHARREWVWILGDDDQPKPDALETIRRVLKADPNAIFHNFSCNVHARPDHFSTSGLLEFVEKIDHVGICIFISTCLYNRKRLTPYVEEAYNHIRSNAPHMALLIACLSKENDGMAVFHADQIVQHRKSPSSLFTYVRIAEVLRAFSGGTERGIFATKLLPTCAAAKSGKYYKLLITQNPEVDRIFVNHLEYSELVFWNVCFEPRLWRRVKWLLWGIRELIARFSVMQRVPPARISQSGASHHATPKLN